MVANADIRRADAKRSFAYYSQKLCLIALGFGSMRGGIPFGTIGKEKQ
jgi:hypothetical protein